MTPAEGVGRLGFETSSNLNARFLCRSIDFLISATVQHDHIGGAGEMDKLFVLLSRTY